MANLGSEALLVQLDELLAANPCTPSYSEDMNDEGYTVQHKQWHQRAAPQFNANVNFVVKTACQFLQEEKSALATTIRICSIGCGDGRMDKIILTKIREQYPLHKFEYVGVDVNAFSCKRARELLEPLENVTATLVAADMLNLDPGELGAFDFIFAVHSLYYVTSVEKALTSILSLLKPSGHFAIACAPCSQLCQLSARFWEHEYKRPYHLAPTVTSLLDKMEVTYTLEIPRKIPLDMTECFKDGFKDPSHRIVVDFISQTKMAQYPASVFQVSVDYLYSIAEGKPDKVVIDHAVNWLVVRHKQK